MPKLGCISASMAKAVLTKGRRKDELYGATFKTEAKKLAAGMLGWDVETDLSEIDHIQHGLEFEPVAIEAYELEHMASVHGAQEWIGSECGRFGCTPDGLVGTDGMIEVKCPKPHNHLDNVLTQAQLSMYNPQMQFSMWVTGRIWCDWISFDPTAPEGLQLYVQRVQRDDDMIVQLAERSEAMYESAKMYAAKLKGIMEGV